MKENITLAFASASTLGKRVFRSVKFLAVDEWIDLHFQNKTAALIRKMLIIDWIIKRKGNQRYYLLFFFVLNAFFKQLNDSSKESGKANIM